MPHVAPGKKVIAVLPAYNAEKTLQRTIKDIPRAWVDEVILVDDASSDNTVALARHLGLTVIPHEKNTGYGGNQKTCYKTALLHGADYVIMIHPDYQYDPKLVPRLLTPLLFENKDVVFGSRMMKHYSALKGGMPWWKYLANIGLTFIGNAVLWLHLSEYHSGFRAYSKKVLEQLPLEKNSNDFIFDTEIIIQIKLAKIPIVEIPISTRYFPEASMIDFRRSVQYGVGILINLCKYMLHISGLKKYSKFNV